MLMFALTSVGLTAVSARTQDPLTVAPDAYRMVFENAWVKVVRVVYGPKAVIAPHVSQPRFAAVRRQGRY